MQKSSHTFTPGQYSIISSIHCPKKFSWDGTMGSRGACTFDSTFSNDVGLSTCEGSISLVVPIDEMSFGNWQRNRSWRHAFLHSLTILAGQTPPGLMSPSNVRCYKEQNRGMIFAFAHRRYPISWAPLTGPPHIYHARSSRRRWVHYDASQSPSKT